MLPKLSEKTSVKINRLRCDQNYAWCDNAKEKKIIKQWVDKVSILKYADATKTHIILSFLLWEIFMIFLFPGVSHIFWSV